jgi:hypothetical protein
VRKVGASVGQPHQPRYNPYTPYDRLTCGINVFSASGLIGDYVVEGWREHAVPERWGRPLRLSIKSPLIDVILAHW